MNRQAAPGSQALKENDADQDGEKRARLVTSFIDRRLNWLGTLAECAKEREGLKSDADTRRFSLPSTEASDKLLRYEAHLDKQLYRAMDQLERLQRRRSGENVPPPLRVELDKRG